MIFCNVRDGAGFEITNKNCALHQACVPNINMRI